MANSTNATVESLATHEAALKTNRLALIGLFGPQDAMQGLVRLPSGRTQTVSAGEKLSSLGRIVAIDAEGLLIDRDGEVGRLPILAN